MQIGTAESFDLFALGAIEKTSSLFQAIGFWGVSSHSRIKLYELGDVGEVVKNAAQSVNIGNFSLELD